MFDSLRGVRSRSSSLIPFLSLALTLLSPAVPVEVMASSADSRIVRDHPQSAQLIAQSAAVQSTEENANILVIHSYSLEFPWTQQLKIGVDEGFKDSDQAVTVYHEFIDSKRYPNLHHAHEFLSYVQKKYEDTPLAAIMISDDPGLDLILETRDQYLPDIPVVFMGINKFRPEILDVPWISGVFETRKPTQTVLEAKRQTGSDSLIIITDSTSTGKGNMKRLEALSSHPDAPSNVVLIEDLSSNAIAQEVGQYPDHWPIFFAGQIRQDSPDGPLINPEKDVALLHAQVPNPLYTDTAPRLGKGAVGGQVLDGHYHAQQAVQLVKELLSGTPIDEIEPLIESENKWIFDAQELERVRIRKSQLPLGSVLINEKPSFYEQYQSLVWFTVIKFSLGILTILLLINAIRRQKRAEKRLKESERQLEQRVLERTSELSETLDELRQTQAQLIHTEKLSSLGQLVGGVAHEFNNPLSFIHSNLKHVQKYIEDLLKLAQLYQDKGIEDPAIEAYVEEIELDYIQQDTPEIIGSMTRGTKRIQDIVIALQKFSRSDEQGLKPTDLNQSIESALLIINTQIGSDITIEKNYETLPSVSCRPGDLNQVIMNILLNSVAALEKVQGVEEKKIMIQTLSPSDRWVEIVVEDNGIGIPTDIQDKVFDPFFTTKPIGQGTGLGLSLCYQIIQQHRGEIQLSSVANKGTTIKIGLPVS